jgi:DNA repair exonuclease SbcCD ATPase subunit
MIYKWIEDCKKNIARLKEELQQAETEEERETIADKIADEQQALEGYKGTASAIEWETDYLNGEL